MDTEKPVVFTEGSLVEFGCYNNKCEENVLTGTLGVEVAVPSSFELSPTIGRFRWHPDDEMHFFRLREPVTCPTIGCSHRINFVLIVATKNGRGEKTHFIGLDH
ncbi:MAG: hypothetical protein UX81_C0027G0005 [Parcubacteria group bacterium GW2011_GWA2_47_12]|nr:MAG: hypothetical protein UX81_C0027G0005 [Parcubacteria group bacterium GW2011_GWA2_47_12]